MYTPNSQWSFMVNYDYGRGDRLCPTCFTEAETFPPTLTNPVSWWGVAGYAKYSPDANDYFAARYEYFDDPDGFTATSSIPGFGDHFSPQGAPVTSFLSTAFNSFGGVKNLHFNEFTVTYQRTLASYLLTRFEYRRDMSDYPVYAMSNFGTGSEKPEYRQHQPDPPVRQPQRQVTARRLHGNKGSERGVRNIAR